MKRLMILLLIFIVQVQTADAQIFKMFRIFRPSNTNTRNVRYNGTVRQYKKVTYNISYDTIISQTLSNQDLKYNSTAALAQHKAEILARTRSVYHPGGGFGAGTSEGAATGRTKNSAITSCCFWGTRNPIAIGTAQGSNGMWYAIVIYR